MFNKDLYLDSLIQAVSMLLENPDLSDLGQVVTIINDRLGSNRPPRGFTLAGFFSAALEEAKDNDLDANTQRRLEQQLNMIISRQIPRLEALEMASDIIYYYEHELIAVATHEDSEAEYAHAIQHAEPELRVVK